MPALPSLYWIIAPENLLLERFTEHDLTPQEKDKLVTFKVEKRRREWLTGRLLVKALLSSTIHSSAKLPLNEIEIRREVSGAPAVFILGQPLQGCVTLSHSQGTLFAAYAPNSNLQPGVDAEKIETRNPAFLEDFFTHSERIRIESDPTKKDLLINLIWSAKEAVMKSLRQGLSIVARDIEIAVPRFKVSERWDFASAIYSLEGKSHPFRIHWMVKGGFVFTISHLASSEVTLHEVVICS